MDLDALTTLETDDGLIPGDQAMARFSVNYLYRITLTRSWRPDLPPVCFVMLNPSTADAFKVDPTVNRCIDFAVRWGHGSLRVVNLFSLRATDPAVMLCTANPVDPAGANGLNDYAIRAMTQEARVIVAWGVHGGHRDRDLVVRSSALSGHTVECLGTTKDGHPRHPLYVPKTFSPVPYAWRTPS